jgi:acyl-ACP thioesterase
MTGRNATFVLVRVKIEVLSMPSIGETLMLRTFPVGMNRSFFIRDFVMGAGGCECANARTCWLVIDLNTHRPIKKDNPAIEAAPFLKGDGPVEVPEKPSAGKSGAKIREIEIGYSHLDILKHVNNTRYLEWLGDCLGSSFFKKGGGYSITVNFSSELREGEKVEIFRNGDIFTGLKENGRECFTAKVERMAEDV